MPGPQAAKLSAPRWRINALRDHGESYARTVYYWHLVTNYYFSPTSLAANHWLSLFSHARSTGINVGGETLESALDVSARYARAIVCGNISAYNTKEPYGVKNLQLLIWREISLHGFLFESQRVKDTAAFFRTMPVRVASDAIRYKEHVVRGLENVGQAILEVQMGKNFGKSVVVVAEE